MKKKITLSVLLFVAVALAAGIAFAAFYRGADTVTMFEKVNIQQYFASSPFETNANGANIHPPVAAAAGSEGSDRNTFLGSKTQLNCAGEYIELNIAVRDDGEVVLADSYSEISDESVAASRVVEEMKKDDSQSKLLLNLSEYSSYSAVASFEMVSDIPCVISGVTENAVSRVKNNFSRAAVLCDYGKSNTRSLKQIKADGADGIRCSADEVSEGLINRAHKAGLFVWADCGDDTYALIKALYFGADAVITLRPLLAGELCNDWNMDVFNDYWINNNQ